MAMDAPAGTPAPPDVPIREEPSWVAPALADVDAALRANPPVFPPTLARQEALMALDGPLHLVHANRFESVRRFYLDRIGRAIEQIENTRVSQGAAIWRLYNSGMVLRTASVTIGCDLVRGWRETAGSPACELSDEWARRLSEQIDVMTVSHAHEDHLDEPLRDLLLARGVPIIVPPGVYEGLVDNRRIICPRRVGPRAAANQVHRLRPLALAGGRELRLNPYPGHQGELPNNMCLFATAEGMSFLHTGDQSTNQDWEWIDQIREHHDVDVMMVNTWTNDPWRLIDGVDPRLVLSMHESEMTHTPNHRESNWSTYRVFRMREDRPAHVLAWGESLTYSPPASPGA